MLKATQQKKVHCNQAEDSQCLNASAMLPTSHAAPPSAWTVTCNTELTY